MQALDICQLTSDKKFQYILFLHISYILMPLCILSKISLSFLASDTVTITQYPIPTPIL